MKEKSVFVCGEYGYESPRWMGKCPQCGSWNTLVEEEKISLPRSGKETRSAVLLKDVPVASIHRASTAIGELDRVLGGGIVPGMTVLLGGSPGIGKSTLLLQMAHSLAESGTVLYVSGEESRHQIKIRADRLGLDGNILILCENDVSSAIEEAKRKKADYLIIDSVQTMLADDSGSAPGSVTQIRAVTSEITRFAKENGTAVFLVGHVTKEGAIAGPKVLEHLVDTVLYFEGESREGLRLLHSVKNRFGSTNELGVFMMTDKGMEGIPDPSGLFLSSGSPSAGLCVTAVMEGTRPLLAETQALLAKSAYASPRRTALGFENSRLNLLLAVLEKKAGLTLFDKDVYLSSAGDLYLGDRGADLAAVMSVASCYYDKPMPRCTVAIGEVGLTGDVRPAGQMETRIRECIRLGYTNIIVPESCRLNGIPASVTRVSSVLEAVSMVAYSK